MNFIFYNVNLQILSNGEISANTNNIGHAGEHNAATITITGRYPEADYYKLNFEDPNGKAYSSDILTPKNGLIVYDVPTVLMNSKGELKCQLTGYIYDSNNSAVLVWKSDIIALSVKESILADSVVPDEYVNPLETAIKNADEAAKTANDTASNILQKAESGEFNGQDGLSPTIEVQEISDGHRVTVADINGSQNFDVLDGTDSNILKAQAVLTSAVNVLTINTDTNGDPFALKSAKINIYVPETATPSGSTSILLRCSINGVESDNSYSNNGSASNSISLGQFRNGGNHAQINLSSVGSDGKYILIGIAPVMSFYDDGTPNITAERYTVTTLEAGSVWEYIHSVKLFPSQSSSVLPIGTAVEVWGY